MIELFTKMGPWELGVKPGTAPFHPTAVSYFASAAAGALRRMLALGFEESDLLGVILFQPDGPTSRVAGYYNAENDELVVTGRHEPRTDYGADLGALYGEDPGDGMMAWAICHEVAHRVWYRRLSKRGQHLWMRFHDAMVHSLSRDTRLGMAHRAGAGPRLAELADVSKARILRASADLSPSERLLGSALFAAFGGGPLEFYSWMRRGKYRLGLATNYAKQKSKESWAEGIAALAMEGGGPRPPENSETEHLVRTVGLAALRA